MADDKKRPVIVRGPAVKDYAKGAEARAAEARKNRPKIGNLAQADAQYKPGKDRPMTIAQITDAQRTVDRETSATPAGLSPQTVKAMEEIAKASAAKRAQMPAGPPMAQPAAAAHPPRSSSPIKEKPMSEAKPDKPAEKPSPEEAKRVVQRELDRMDDFDIEKLMRSMQEDVINNDRERDHVGNPENKRVTEIDFIKGIANNSFEQWVDIIPGKLKVHYRTITPLENQAIRLWIVKRASEDERIDRLASEIYGLAQVVASIIQINGSQMPVHLKGEGPNTQFDEEAFALKYNQFQNYPNPLIHAIGVHGQWFDQRVRQLFTTDALKNG